MKRIVARVIAVCLTLSVACPPTVANATAFAPRPFNRHQLSFYQNQALIAGLRQFRFHPFSPQGTQADFAQEGVLARTVFAPQSERSTLQVGWEWLEIAIAFVLGALTGAPLAMVSRSHAPLTEPIHPRLADATAAREQGRLQEAVDILTSLLESDSLSPNNLLAASLQAGYALEGGSIPTADHTKLANLVYQRAESLRIQYPSLCLFIMALALASFAPPALHRGDSKQAVEFLTDARSTLDAGLMAARTGADNELYAQLVASINYLFAQALFFLWDETFDQKLIRDAIKRQEEATTAAQHFAGRDPDAQEKLIRGQLFQAIYLTESTEHLKEAAACRPILTQANQLLAKAKPHSADTRLNAFVEGLLAFRWGVTQNYQPSLSRAVDFFGQAHRAGYPPATKYLVQAYSRLGQFDEALATAFEITDPSGLDLYRRAVLLSRVLRLDDALQDLELAIQKPDVVRMEALGVLPNVYRTLIYILIQRGRHEEACRYVEHYLAHPYRPDGLIQYLREDIAQNEVYERFFTLLESGSPEARTFAADLKTASGWLTDEQLADERERVRAETLRAENRFAEALAILHRLIDGHRIALRRQAVHVISTLPLVEDEVQSLDSASVRLRRMESLRAVIETPAIDRKDPELIPLGRAAADAQISLICSIDGQLDRAERTAQEALKSLRVYEASLQRSAQDFGGASNLFLRVHVALWAARHAAWRTTGDPKFLQQAIERVRQAQVALRPFFPVVPALHNVLVTQEVMYLEELAQAVDPEMKAELHQNAVDLVTVHQEVESGHAMQIAKVLVALGANDLDQARTLAESLLETDVTANAAMLFVQIVARGSSISAVDADRARRESRRIHQPGADDLYDRGRVEFLAGEYQRALDIWEPILSEQVPTGSFAATGQRARLYQDLITTSCELSREDEAIAWALRALDERPDDASAIADRLVQNLTVSGLRALVTRLAQGDRDHQAVYLRLKRLVLDGVRSARPAEAKELAQRADANPSDWRDRWQKDVLGAKKLGPAIIDGFFDAMELSLSSEGCARVLLGLTEGLLCQANEKHPRLLASFLHALARIPCADLSLDILLSLDQRLSTWSSSESDFSLLSAMSQRAPQLGISERFEATQRAVAAERKNQEDLLVRQQEKAVKKALWAPIVERAIGVQAATEKRLAHWFPLLALVDGGPAASLVQRAGNTRHAAWSVLYQSFAQLTSRAPEAARACAELLALEPLIQLVAQSNPFQTAFNRIAQHLPDPSAADDAATSTDFIDWLVQGDPRLSNPGRDRDIKYALNEAVMQRLQTNYHAPHLDDRRRLYDNLHRALRLESNLLTVVEYPKQDQEHKQIVLNVRLAKGSHAQLAIHFFHSQTAMTDTEVFFFERDLHHYRLFLPSTLSQDRQAVEVRIAVRRTFLMTQGFTLLESERLARIHETTEVGFETYVQNRLPGPHGDRLREYVQRSVNRHGAGHLLLSYLQDLVLQDHERWLTPLVDLLIAEVRQDPTRISSTPEQWVRRIPLQPWQLARHDFIRAYLPAVLNGDKSPETAIRAVLQVGETFDKLLLRAVQPVRMALMISEFSSSDAASSLSPEIRQAIAAAAQEASKNSEQAFTYQTVGQDVALQDTPESNALLESAEIPIPEGESDLEQDTRIGILTRAHQPTLFEDTRSRLASDRRRGSISPGWKAVGFFSVVLLLAVAGFVAVVGLPHGMTFHHLLLLVQAPLDFRAIVRVAAMAGVLALGMTILDRLRSPRHVTSDEQRKAVATLWEQLGKHGILSEAERSKRGIVAPRSADAVGFLDPRLHVTVFYPQYPWSQRTVRSAHDAVWDPAIGALQITMERGWDEPLEIIRWPESHLRERLQGRASHSAIAVIDPDKMTAENRTTLFAMTSASRDATRPYELLLSEGIPPEAISKLFVTGPFLPLARAAFPNAEIIPVKRQGTRVDIFRSVEMGPGRLERTKREVSLIAPNYVGALEPLITGSQGHVLLFSIRFPTWEDLTSLPGPEDIEAGHRQQIIEASQHLPAPEALAMLRYLGAQDEAHFHLVSAYASALLSHESDEMRHAATKVLEHLPSDWRQKHLDAPVNRFIRGLGSVPLTVAQAIVSELTLFYLHGKFSPRATQLFEEVFPPQPDTAHTIVPLETRVATTNASIERFISSLSSKDAQDVIVFIDSYLKTDIAAHVVAFLYQLRRHAVDHLNSLPQNRRGSLPGLLPALGFFGIVMALGLLAFVALTGLPRGISLETIGTALLAVLNSGWLTGAISLFAIGVVGMALAPEPPQPSVPVTVAATNNVEEILRLAKTLLVPETLEAVKGSGIYSGYDLSRLKSFRLSVDSTPQAPRIDRERDELILPLPSTSTADPEAFLSSIRRGIWKVLRVKPLALEDHLNPSFKELVGPAVIDDINLLASWQIDKWSDDLLNRLVVQGRSFYLRLPKPILNNGRAYPAVRLKGIAAFECIPPLMKARKRGRTLSVTSMGTLKPAMPDPLGGIEVETILQEGEALQELYAQGSPVSIFGGYLEYPDQKFEGSSTGVSVMLTLDERDERNLKKIVGLVKTDLDQAGKYVLDNMQQLGAVIISLHSRERRAWGWPHLDNMLTYEKSADLRTKLHDFEDSERLDKTTFERAVALRFRDLYLAIRELQSFNHPAALLALSAGFLANYFQNLNYGHFAERFAEARKFPHTTLDWVQSILVIGDLAGLTPVALLPHPVISSLRLIEGEFRMPVRGIGPGTQNRQPEPLEAGIRRIAATDGLSLDEVAKAIETFGFSSIPIFETAFTSETLEIFGHTVDLIGPLVGIPHGTFSRFMEIVSPTAGERHPMGAEPFLIGNRPAYNARTHRWGIEILYYSKGAIKAQTITRWLTAIDQIKRERELDGTALAETGGNRYVSEGAPNPANQNSLNVGTVMQAVLWAPRLVHYGDSLSSLNLPEDDPRWIGLFDRKDGGPRRGSLPEFIPGLGLLGAVVALSVASFLGTVKVGQHFRRPVAHAA